MGKIGQYEYPEQNIDKCVAIVEEINESNITKQDLLAEKLGHNSTKSGSFRGKVASLRRYGLTAGRGEVKLSQLGRQIANPAPNSDEREKALGQAVLNVSLLAQLYDRLEYEPTDGEFWYHIVELTEVKRSEAKDKSGKIEQLYKHGLDYALTQRDLKSQHEGENQNIETENSDTNNINHNDEIISNDADATLVTENAQISVVNRSTYLAAKALFDDLGKKYEE